MSQQILKLNFVKFNGLSEHQGSIVVAGICRNQAFPEMPRQFWKCLGNWGNLWFFKNNSILGNSTPLKSLLKNQN
jgi:hypothetical protein